MNFFNYSQYRKQIKRRFKFSELFWVVREELKHLLIFWVGAWFWESILFIAARLGELYWYWSKDSDDEKKIS